MSEAIISKYVEFDAGHRVPMHASKCSNPHGHRYRVTAYVRGPILEPRGESDDGMVVDFGDLKRVLTEHVHDVYDHGFMVWVHDRDLLDVLLGHDWRVVVTQFVPTAENLARDIYFTLRTHLPAALTVTAVDVHETPTSVARYEAAQA